MRPITLMDLCAKSAIDIYKLVAICVTKFTLKGKMERILIIKL